MTEAEERDYRIRDKNNTSDRAIKLMFVNLSVIEKVTLEDETQEEEEESCLIQIHPQYNGAKEVAGIFRSLKNEIYSFLMDCVNNSTFTQNPKHCPASKGSQETFSRNNQKRKSKNSCKPKTEKVSLQNNLSLQQPKQNCSLGESKDFSASTWNKNTERCKQMLGQRSPQGYLSSDNESNFDVNEDYNGSVSVCYDNYRPPDENIAKHHKYYKAPASNFENNESLATVRPSNNWSRSHSIQFPPSNCTDEFICELCDKQFTTKGSLKRHIAQQHISNRVRTFKCQKCRRGFQTLYSLTVHKRTHNNQLATGKFVCDTCRKQFLCRSSYLVHVRRTGHCGQSAFTCKECNKCFTQQATLDIHIKRHHQNHGNYLRCQKCNHKFTTKNGLQKHTTKDTCLASFECEKCQKVFKQPNLLKAHLQTHISQNQSLNEGYQCHKCFRRFATMRGFSAHERHCSVPTSWIRSKNSTTDSQKTSNRYICEICGNNFSQSSSLHKHTKKHSNVRPYQCHMCLKSFFDKFGLQVHIRTHTGEKPYLCNSCGKSFICNSKLKRHMRSHNNEASVYKAKKSELNVKKVKPKLKASPAKNTFVQNQQLSPPMTRGSTHQPDSSISDSKTSHEPEYLEYQVHNLNHDNSLLNVEQEQPEILDTLYYTHVPNCVEQTAPYQSLHVDHDEYHYNVPPPPYPIHQYSNIPYTPDRNCDANNFRLVELNSFLPPYELNNVTEQINHNTSPSL